MAPYSSTLAWKIPWTEEPGRLQSMGSLRIRHNWVTSLSLHFHALEKEVATHCSVLAWRIPGTGEPGGLLSMGLHRVGHDWSDLAAAAAGSVYGILIHTLPCEELCERAFCIIVVVFNKTGPSGKIYFYFQHFRLSLLFWGVNIDGKDLRV